LFQSLIKNDYWKVSPSEKAFVCNFCYPIIHPKREEIVEALKAANVEVRPLIAGSMGKQPFYTDRYGVLELPNVSVVDKYGCYVPNNQDMTKEDVEYIAGVINSVINK
jgi:CDP-4-dehydro-6-deoxyglucose reductase, E1